MKENGFNLDRVSGSHHVFVHPEFDTPVNAQKRKDGKAKAYQVKQAIRTIDGEEPGPEKWINKPVLIFVVKNDFEID